MKTLALRFGETFSPTCGTIKAHQQVIDKLGYVWYGKIGSTIADSKLKIMKEERTDKILLIHSGGFDRWWAYIVEITKDTPENGIPDYYHSDSKKFKMLIMLGHLSNGL